MMKLMRERLLRVVCWLLVVLSPSLALAADDEKLPDARIQNYPKPVSVPEAGRP